MTAFGLEFAWSAPWLSRLPASWEVRPLRRCGVWQKERNASGEGRLLSLSATRGLIPKEWEDANQERTGDGLAKYWRAEPDDLVINPMWVMHGGIAVSEITGVVSPDYRVYRLGPDLHPRYIHHLVRSQPYLTLYPLLSRGQTTFDRRVGREDFEMLPIVIPPLAIQQAVAAFLDKKTTAIDALIEKKERLIALLHERRQALITSVVTKGLDPKAATKDSGIGWLGAVPAHWAVMPTRRICKLTTGYRDTQDAKEDGAFPFFVRSQTVERIDTYSFDGEGVLTSGDGAGVGKIFHHTKGKFEFHQRVYLYYDFDGILGRYFFYYLREQLHRVVLAGNAKSTVDSLRRPMLMSFPVCVPPLSEQAAIIAMLDGATERLDELDRDTVRSIELLREHRQALVTAAVTGQVSVTEDAA